MSGFAELAAATNYSFLRGASHPSDMVARAMELGMAGIGIADRNSVAGVVRAHMALREAGKTDFRLAVGTRLVFADGTPDIVAYPETRFGWGRLTRLLTVGNLRAEKGDCILRLEDLLEHCEDLLLIVLPSSRPSFHRHPREGGDHASFATAYLNKIANPAIAALNGEEETEKSDLSKKKHALPA